MIVGDKVSDREMVTHSQILVSAYRKEVFEYLRLKHGMSVRILPKRGMKLFQQSLYTSRIFLVGGLTCEVTGT